MTAAAGRAETTTAGDEVHPSGVSFRWVDDLAETTTATIEDAFAADLRAALAAPTDATKENNR